MFEIIKTIVFIIKILSYNGIKIKHFKVHNLFTNVFVTIEVY